MSAKANRELAAELQDQISGDVRFDEYQRALYNTDASIYQMDPIGVVLPRDTDDVSKVVKLARQAGVPILPRGGGTSLAGQGTNRAIVLDFSKYMARLLEVNPEEGWARVQPGIVLDVLSGSVAKYGLKYGPDPATANRATIGGGIGNNSCGSHSIVYGKTLDHVLELDVVLSDGTETRFQPLPMRELSHKRAAVGLEAAIYRDAAWIAQEHAEEVEKRYPKILRRVGGYNLDELLKDPGNLARLVVGSEGTLVAVTGAKVRLVDRPHATAVAVLHFSSLMEAMEATVELLQEPVSVIELMDETIITQGRQQISMSKRMSFIEGEPKALLLVEVYGENQDDAAKTLSGVIERVKRQRLGYASVKFVDPVDQANVWAIRRDGLGLIMSLRGDAKAIPFVEDTAVSPEKLPEYIRRFDQIVEDHGTTSAHYGHASVGCIHVRPIIDLKSIDGLSRMEAIADDVADLVLEFGGSLSGEHGYGIVRGGFTERMFGPRLYEAFHALKTSFDPTGIMNPNKIIDTPPMTDNLRISPDYRTHSITTTFDFSHDGGFSGMVEMCNGQGACRKTTGGTMCPSFMVTREEEHSTRGRANALRAVLSGTLPHRLFTEKRLFETLDLCLECKACKAECPSSVDMAKLKSEFLSHYNQVHGLSMRTRLFNNIHRLNQIGCALAPFSNWVVKSRFSRWMLSLIGIHCARSLPEFARPTFSAWFGAHQPASAAGKRGRAVLFGDTFTEGNYPSVGIAATKLLEEAGFQVDLVPTVCCGRPLISSGVLDRAKLSATRNVERLYPWAKAGIPIIGIEPSCLLTIRDEYLSLLPGDDKAMVVAANTFLLDEFLAKLHRSGELDIEFRPVDKKLLFHGHCHQKALIGVEDSALILNLVDGTDLTLIDAGCCGMAGAFGFASEHYQLSMDIGERSLFPSVRGNPDATIVVTGISCRQQVEQGTGVKALHLAEFLASVALRKDES